MKFEVGTTVLVDPYNEITNNAVVNATITGVILKSMKTKSDVLSLQTMDVFSIPNKYLFCKVDVKDLFVNNDNVVVSRTSTPVFTEEELWVLHKINESVDFKSIQHKMVFNHIIQKVEANLIDNEICKILSNSKDSVNTTLINTIIDYDVKENTEENIKDTIKMIGNLQEAMDCIESGVYEIHYKKILSNCADLINRIFEEEGYTKESIAETMDMIASTSRVLGNENTICNITIDSLALVINNVKREAPDLLEFAGNHIDKLNLSADIKVKVALLTAAFLHGDNSFDSNPFEYGDDFEYGDNDEEGAY